MASAPKVPSLEPLSANQRSQLNAAGRGSGVLDPTRTATDPAMVNKLRGQFAPAAEAIMNLLSFGEYQHPGDTVNYLKAVAHSLNPTTPEGALSLAAMFMPGRQLTARQQQYLDQLQTHAYYGRDIGYKPGHFPGTPVNPVSRAEAMMTPELKAIAEHLGHTYGNPLPELMVNTGKVHPSFAESRLGLGSKDAFQNNMGGLDWSKTSITKPIDPNSQRMIDLIARSNINRRN